MQTLQKIADFAYDVHKRNLDGHGFDHIERVVKLAEQILPDYPKADKPLVLVCCYLHDTYDDKLVTNVEAQKKHVAGFLTQVGFEQSRQDQIFYIIDNMSFSSNLMDKKELDINGQIVQDADRIDALGAWGIYRALEYGFAHDRQLFDPKQTPKSFRSKEEYHQYAGTTVNHFYEKLLLTFDTLNTERAKKLAAPRQKIMQDFVAQVKAEWEQVYGD